MEDKIIYKRTHLKKLALWLINNQKDQIFHNAEANQQKSDGIDNRLFIEDLLISSTSQKNMSDELINDLTNSVHAFKNLDGDSWLPVLRLEGNFLQKSGDADIIIAIEDTDGESTIYTPFLPGEDDNLIPYEGPFNQEAIGDNPMLVVELEPCSDMSLQPEYFDSPCDSGSVGGDLGNGGSGSGGNVRFLKIVNMKIKDRKEGWPGRSEIEFKGYKLPLTTITPNITIDCGDPVYASTNCDNYNGKRIKDMRYDDEGDTFDMNWTISRDEGYTDAVLVYVIFEYDSWPATIRSAYQSLPNGATSLIEYRSYEADYNKQVLSQNQSLGYPYVYGFNFDGSWIKYNLN